MDYYEKVRFAIEHMEDYLVSETLESMIEAERVETSPDGVAAYVWQGVENGLSVADVVRHLIDESLDAGDEVDPVEARHVDPAEA